MTDRLKTFADLEQASTVISQDLLATLEDYAQSGAAISSRVVIGVLMKTRLARGELETLSASAQKGIAVHRAMSDGARFRHLPPEVSVRTDVLTAAIYGEGARREKQEAEKKEANEYLAVLGTIRQLLEAVTA